MLSLLYILNVIKYRKASHLSREELLKVQQKQWLKLLKFVAKKSPYYAEIIKNINLPLEQIRPEHFPVLTKDLISANFDRIVTDPKIKLKDLMKHALDNTPEKLYLGRYNILKTSGSTGIPHHFIATTKEVIQSVTPSVARGSNSKPQKGSKKRICMLGIPHSYCSSNQNMNITNSLWIARQFVEYHLVSMIQPFENVVAELNALQPQVVSGYAKLLLLLADAQRLGSLKINPESIESGGEPLLNTDRKYLKEVFNCSVNNHYGSTEGYSMGISRDGENSMELFEDHIYFEILEKSVRITNLHNFTMPLIRYEMNDVLVPIQKTTTSPFQKVQSGVGRPEGIPYFTSLENDKITIHPIEFDPLMPEGVKSFAMICEKPNCVEYSIFIDENYKNKVEAVKAEALKVIKDFFAEKGLPNIQVEVVIAKDYKVNPNSLKTQLWKNAAYQEDK